MKDRRKKLEGILKTIIYQSCAGEDDIDAIEALFPVSEWISVKDRLPEFEEDGESANVLCAGFKCGRPDTVQYEVMTWTHLENPRWKDSKGNLITQGWSRSWWNDNPDNQEIRFWKPISPPKI